MTLDELYTYQKALRDRVAEAEKKYAEYANLAATYNVAPPAYASGDMYAKMRELNNKAVQAFREANFVNPKPANITMFDSIPMPGAAAAPTPQPAIMPQDMAQQGMAQQPIAQQPMAQQGMPAPDAQRIQQLQTILQNPNFARLPPQHQQMFRTAAQRFRVGMPNTPVNPNMPVTPQQPQPQQPVAQNPQQQPNLQNQIQDFVRQQLAQAGITR